MSEPPMKPPKKPMSTAMQGALAALRRMKPGDREVTEAEIRWAMNVEAELRRRRQRDDADDDREPDERLH